MKILHSSFFQARYYGGFPFQIEASDKHFKTAVVCGLGDLFDFSFTNNIIFIKSQYTEGREQ